jgi:hypothetical protein
VDPSVYSAHSFRRGGASYAFELGLSPLQIKLRGDWASVAYERYVYISTGATFAVARALAGESRVDSCTGHGARLWIHVVVRLARVLGVGVYVRL